MEREDMGFDDGRAGGYSAVTLNQVPHRRYSEKKIQKLVDTKVITAEFQIVLEANRRK